jgi:hypothetical protein
MSKAAELAALIGSQSARGYKNVIINGSMDIAQRGTSQTAAGYGTIDRYSLALSGATATMTQEAFSTSDRNSLGFEKYLKLAVSTANNNAGIYHRIEANNAVHLIGLRVTFSFYAKGTNPAGGSFQMKPQWYNNSSGGGDNGVEQSLTITSTWTRYSFTFEIPTPSNTTIDTNAYLGFEILQPAGDTSTTAWELNTTGWQVEIGETATPFEHEDIGTTLAKCQRYYYRIGGVGTYHRYAVGSCQGTSSCGVVIYPPAGEMRAVPALETTGTASNYAIYEADGVNACSSIPAINSVGTNSKHFNITFASSGNLASGNAAEVLANNNADAFLAFQSEL